MDMAGLCYNAQVVLDNIYDGFCGYSMDCTFLSVYSGWTVLRFIGNMSRFYFGWKGVLFTRCNG